MRTVHPEGASRTPHPTVLQYLDMLLLSFFIATPLDRGWQRNEGLLLLHSFLSLDILVSIFGT